MEDPTPQAAITNNPALTVLRAAALAVLRCQLKKLQQDGAPKSR
jgi:hypothetical protein